MSKFGLLVYHSAAIFFIFNLNKFVNGSREQFESLRGMSIRPYMYNVSTF